MSSARPLRWLLISQNIILFALALVFPYYIIFIREIGTSYAEFAFAYALFSLSAALMHICAGMLSDRFGQMYLLAASAWATAFALLFFPSVTALWQVYLLQVVMGVASAFQKTGEKAAVILHAPEVGGGKEIGRYHMWTAVCSAFAVVAAGYLIDLFSLDIVFYASSLSMFVGGFVSLKIKRTS
jgi:MFS family permease